VQNPILYQLLSGNAWFACGLVILTVAALDGFGTFAKSRLPRRLAHFLLILSIPLAALTGTPLSLWLAAPLAVACMAYAAIGFNHSKRKLRLPLAACAAALVATALLAELPYHLTRPPALPRPRRLYVVADSLTAGMGERLTWPRLLQQTTALEVRDLSKPGATVASALTEQAPALYDADTTAWVFVEIGGNDMLGDTPADAFAEQLDQLLAVCRGDPASPRTVLMMELPVFIGRWSYGVHQRRLAAKHGVVLIPKRVLAGVLAERANTRDGLHLSRAGHEHMAQLILPWLGQSE
jgi:lysophospholipase L1-like esterase